MPLADAPAPLRLIFEKLVDAPRRTSSAITACGILMIAIAVSTLVGWLGAIEVLVQPSVAFQPMRPLSAIAFALVGWATVAAARGRRDAAGAVGFATLAIVAAGVTLPLLGVSLPLDTWSTAQAARMQSSPIAGIAPPIAAGLAVYTIALLLTNRRAVTRGEMLAAYALGILLVAAAGVLAIVHVSDLQIGVQSRIFLGAGLQPLLGMTLLGVTLVLLVSRARPVPTSPPRWVPAFASATMATLVVVLWLVLRADNKRDDERQAQLAADAFARAVRTQLETTGRALQRRASFAAQFTPDSDGGQKAIELLVDDIEGLDQVLWIRGTGEIAATISGDALVPPFLGDFLKRRVQSLLPGQPESAVDAIQVEALPSDRWTIALLAPVRTGNRLSVLAAVLDQDDFLRNLVNDSSSGFRAQLLPERNAAPGAWEHRFRIGTKPIHLRMTPLEGTRRRASALPDVVLVLGLGMCALLGIVLQLLRTTWTQARVVESARLQAALDKATDGVWEFDFTTRLGRRSSGQLRQLGYDADAIDTSSRRWAELIHPEDNERVLAIVERNAASTDASVDEMVYRVRAADDSWHTIVDRGRVIERTADGRPKIMFGISADITERQRADAAREQSDRRFRVIFESAQQFQALLDADGCLLEANATALTMAGVPADDVVGKRMVDGPWWQQRSEAKDVLTSHLSEALHGEVIRFEVATQFAGGRSGVLDFSFTPIFDADGGVVQVLAEGRDVTERRRAEEALREIGALTTMGRLAARVAHEINNPLAGIQNSFLLLADAIPTDHPHHRFVGAIEREIQRIAVVTRQLYETYRPDQSSSASSSVVLAVNDAVSFLDQVNRGRGVRIVTDVSRAPSSIPIPDALLRQTLYNLVQNAVEASPPNGVVTVTAARDGQSCVIVVRDEGMGIAPHLHDRIWDPFFSTKDSKVKTSGMGLGLALVRQSVEAVGGTIQLVESLEGGATFEVRLPMTPVTRVAGDRQGVGVG